MSLKVISAYRVAKQSRSTYRYDADMSKFEAVSNFLYAVLRGPLGIRVMSMMVFILDDPVSKELKLIRPICVVFDDAMVAHGNVGKQSLPHLDDSYGMVGKTKTSKAEQA